MKFKGILAVLLRKTALLSCCLLLLMSSCKRTETLESLTLDELVPLQVGKYITYRLDSTVFTNTGKTTEIHRYRVRHTIERQSVDNQNRPAWVVVTHITDSLGVGPWVQNGTYTITQVDKRLEVTENNLRVIKLSLPTVEGFTWKGNTYLPNHPYAPEFPLGIDGSMGIWDFKYEKVNNNEVINGIQLADVTTVFHIDESLNVPIISNTEFASRELSIEKYAKGIGLVYREFALWENQPRDRTVGTPPNQVTVYDPVLIGFGVKMWMIDKN